MKPLNLLTALVISSSLSTPLITNQNNSIQKDFSVSVTQNKIQNSKILNFDDAVRQALYFDYLNDNPDANISQVLNINTDNLKHTNENATINGNPWSVEIPHSIYFGESIFQNEFDISQTFLTPPFIQSVTNIYNSEVKWGINTSVEVSINIFKYSFKIWYNKIETETNTETTILTSPSQEIIVPPNKTYKVTIFLAGSEGKALVDLNKDISGILSAEIVDQNGSHNRYVTHVAKAFKAMKKLGTLPQGISIKKIIIQLFLREQQFFQQLLIKLITMLKLMISLINKLCKKIIVI